MGGVVVLAGFAGAANASATVDLIWIDNTDTACTNDGRRDCPRLGTTISSAAVTDNITLGVIITAGPLGILGAGVSVDYGNAIPMLSVSGFRSLTTTQPFPYLPMLLSDTSDVPPFVDNINAAAAPPFNVGIGLPAGQSAYLGTVSFHQDLVVNGIFEIAVGANGPGGTDGVVALNSVPVGANITATTTFNSALLFSLGDPEWCTDSQGNWMEIEVNALRAGGKTVRAGPNQTVDVTAKARILKGTALPGTTIDTTLTIEALDGTGVIGTNSTGPITLGVGKGGRGAKLAVDTEQCVGGFIEFVATFFGADDEGDHCERTRTLRKQCK
jgi:hypothetical protein